MHLTQHLEAIVAQLTFQLFGAIFLLANKVVEMAQYPLCVCCEEREVLKGICKGGDS